MDVIQYGGLDVLEKAMRTHSTDNFISLTIPKIIKYIRGFNVCNIYLFMM